jgi:hypothetical protein
MSIQWSNIRIPTPLLVRLKKAAAAMLLSYQDHGGSLPSKHVEKVPLYHVIERALAELQVHKRRARQQSRRLIQPRTTAQPDDGMYTSKR